MRRAVAAALLLVALVTSSGVLASAAQSRYEWMRTVTLYVPAVTYTGEGYVGVLTKLTVTVAWPGHGIVYFAAEPLAELDTQAAAVEAAMVAALLTGVNFYSYDYFIHLEANSTIVGGPSASGAMAVAIMAALRGKSIPSNFSMTGMVDPDATLGPVGGIPEKLEAAASHGVKLFVIPAGQTVALDLNTGSRVNVTALGRSLGVKVVPAGTILEAYVLATHDTSLARRLQSLVLTSFNLYDKLPALKKSLEDAYALFKRCAEGNVSEAKSLSANLPAPVADTVDQLVTQATSYLGQARTLYGLGDLYSAASKAFAAALMATTAASIAKAFSGNTSSVQVLLGEAKHYLSAASHELAGAEKSYKIVLGALRRSMTDIGLQLAVATQVRIDDAKLVVSAARHYLSAASSASGGQQLEDALAALHSSIYAYYRALTAHQWLSLLEELRSEGTAIKSSDIPRIADAYYFTALSAETYLETLAQAVGAQVQPPHSLLEARHIVSTTRLKGNLSASLRVIALSVSALSQIATETHKIFETSVVSTINASASSLSVLIGLDKARGVLPLLPLLYREYAEVQQDVDAQLALYMQAASYAILLGLVAPKSLQPPPSPKPRTVTVTKTVTSTVTATKTTTVTLVHTVTSTVTKKVTTTTTATRTVTSTTTRHATVTVVSSTTTTVTKTPSAALTALELIIGFIVGLAVGYLGARRR